MEALNFNLQIEMFATNNDEWETQDSFWCVFNEGYFRNTSSGNCQKWEDNFWHLGKVEKNKYGSYDLIKEHGFKTYKNDEEALKMLEKLSPILVTIYLLDHEQ